MWSTQEMAGWGRYPVVEGLAARLEKRKDAHAALAAREGDSLLGVGRGRSYGDVGLNSDGRALLTERLNCMLDFDPNTGWLKCEAGVTIYEMIEVFAPRGFFPPVVPGTRHVTAAGALANDIHGKNHHVDGTWADHVRNVEILTASGDVVFCDAEQEPELFWATVGGLGLTGFILSMEVRLTPIQSQFIEFENTRVENLDHFFEISAATKGYTHTVTWVDCLQSGQNMGRGIFMAGRHAHAQDSSEQVDRVAELTDHLERFVDLQGVGQNWFLNKLTMKAFNEAFYRKQYRKKLSGLVGFKPFFFPLDIVRNWNHVYGPRGFLQYQIVLPHERDHAVLSNVLKTISTSGMASFLSVLKEFGDKVHGGLSFPQPGVTLALDIPNHGSALLQMLDRLDDMVAEAGGRVYLCKDARLSQANFRKMYPEWEHWRAVKEAWDPAHVFQSDMGRRLGLCGD